MGRFLEHSRIFYFENGGEPEVYLGSADWMPRNLYERVEVLFPLKDAQLRERVVSEILASYLSDTRKAHFLGPDGTYSRPHTTRHGPAFCAQEHLIKVAEEAAATAERAATPLILRAVPITGVSKNGHAPATNLAAETAEQETANPPV